MALIGNLIGRGATGSKPAASIAGRLYYDTTLSKLQRDNGATWDDCEPSPGTGQVGTVNFVIDGGGTVITTGVKGDLMIDFACTLTGWTMLANEAGAMVVDIWRDTYANFPPTDADAIPGAGKEPTIVATNAKGQDLAITDWTDYTLDAGDILRFNVDSCTTITRVTLALAYTR